MTLGAGLAAFPAVPTAEIRGDGATKGDPAVEVTVFVLLMASSVGILPLYNQPIFRVFLCQYPETHARSVGKTQGRTDPFPCPSLTKQQGTR